MKNNEVKDGTGYGETIRALKGKGYSLGSNNDLWWLHAGDIIATKNGNRVPVAEIIRLLLESNAELLDALRAFARLGVEDCEHCAGTGQCEDSHNDIACSRCGGVGELVTGFPHPDDILNARAAIAKATEGGV